MDQTTLKKKFPHINVLCTVHTMHAQKRNKDE